ncbi:MAG: anti-sigma regulatory factor [Polyangiales bacterium]
MAGPSKKGDAIRAVLASYVSRMIAQSVLRAALDRARVDEADLDRGVPRDALLREIRRGISIFVSEESHRNECMNRLDELMQPTTPAPAVVAETSPFALATAIAARPHVESHRSVEVPILDENGIVDARTRARELAGALGFSTIDQYKLATAVSELSRNIFRYAGKGKMRFGPVSSPRAGMFIIARDEGPGISDIALVMSDRYVSKTGLGRGLRGCKRIMDDFSIESTVGRGTTVTLRKYLAC